MTGPTESAYTSATDLARQIADRERSPVEVLEAVAGRIEDRNGSLNAFVHLALDEARARAVDAERQVLRDEPLGPLHGVPKIRRAHV